MVKVTIGAINYDPGSSKKNKTGSWRSMRPVIDMDKCKLCWLCFIYCPDAAIKKTDDGPVVDYDYCKGCGICAVECKHEAVVMEEEVK